MDGRLGRPVKNRRGGPPPHSNHSRQTDETHNQSPANRTRFPHWAARKRGLAIGAFAALASTVFAVLFTYGIRHRSTSPATEPLPPPVALADTSAISAADFVGSEQCASCHAQQFAAWKGSTHGRAGGPPGSVALLARFDGTPIRFKDATVIPSSTGGIYSFVVRRTARPDETFRIDGVIGGGHMLGGGTQGFVSRMSDGTLRFLPFDFAKRENAWFCNTNTRLDHGWVPITPNLPLAACGDWPPTRIVGDDARAANCSGCHGSQVQVHFDTTTKHYDTHFTSLTINCESCHGPGKRHLQLVAKGSAQSDLGMRPLATLDKTQSVRTCLQCHAVKDELRPGYLPGKSLESHFSVALALLGDSPLHPDGRTRTFAYQEGHLFSECYRNGGMTCTDCHDPHSQTYRDVSGRALPGRADDRQCTSCHVSKTVSIETHTRHAATSPGSRCVSCHMPYLQEHEIGQAIRYARSDHTIPVPRPAVDSAEGVTPACVSCHANKSVAQLDADVKRLWGATKPRSPLVDAMTDTASLGDRLSASRRLLAMDALHPAARFASLGTFLIRYLHADMPSLERSIAERLTQLTDDPDLDVRALALASLHFARGSGASARAALRQHLSSAGASDDALRRRWRIALGYLGDAARARNDPAAAIVAYRKSLEVLPGDAQTLLNLGLALAQAGDHAAAADEFRRSLAVNSAQPLAFVNLGLALEEQNDVARAAVAYRRAIELNPFEVAAFVNLGNAFLRAQQPADAIPFYRRALALDRSLASAHFYLARALALTGDYASALKEVDDGLEFRPGDADGVELRSQLVASQRQ